MKIILISDPHIKVRGERVRGVDPVERLELCVHRAQQLAGDADLCVMMGDNADTPTEDEYRTLLDCVRPLKMPVRFLIGNHDNRDMFLRVNPDLERDERGYIQSSLETATETLLFLDTGRTGEHEGDYCNEKLDWLKRELSKAGVKPVYIFMHHPPFRTGFWNDHSMVRQADDFLTVLNEARSVRHIFLGHTHRASSGHWNGVTWTTLHGTCYENDFEMLPAKPNYRSGPAQLGILLINGGESVLHFQDVLNPYPLIAYSGRSIREPEIAA
ncbi:metallophosphoesterase [Bradyrhizobium sp. sBnM-33]|uniref:metallophosphoesterase n=1 Tax=Bradyrhizobium sp. sBnM-33 TaxID=2831780 RepID=UPI001BCB22C7|nr:metallophosphoesterase [Bradyrhizobium sp. sBnM-33]WOH52590.1 metallophosphoesterase [Bradyrhizobium sp. sBnM-33]